MHIKIYPLTDWGFADMQRIFLFLILKREFSPQSIHGQCADTEGVTLGGPSLSDKDTQDSPHLQKWLCLYLHGGGGHGHPHVLEPDNMGLEGPI